LDAKGTLWVLGILQTTAGSMKLLILMVTDEIKDGYLRHIHIKDV